MVCATSLLAQTKPLFKGLFYNSEYKIALRLDLESESITVPGFEILGKTHGYMSGGLVYSTWIVTGCKKKDGKAVVRLTDDFGSDTQEIEIAQLKADTFSVELKSPVVMRKVVKRKLVKLNVTKFTFVKN